MRKLIPAWRLRIFCLVVMVSMEENIWRQASDTTWGKGMHGRSSIACSRAVTARVSGCWRNKAAAAAAAGHDDDDDDDAGREKRLRMRRKAHSFINSVQQTHWAQVHRGVKLKNIDSCQRLPGHLFLPSNIRILLFMLIVCPGKNIGRDFREISRSIIHSSLRGIGSSEKWWTWIHPVPSWTWVTWWDRSCPRMLMGQMDPVTAQVPAFHWKI